MAGHPAARDGKLTVFAGPKVCVLGGVKSLQFDRVRLTGDIF